MQSAKTASASSLPSRYLGHSMLNMIRTDSRVPLATDGATHFNPCYRCVSGQRGRADNEVDPLRERGTLACLPRVDHRSYHRGETSPETWSFSSTHIVGSSRLTEYTAPSWILGRSVRLMPSPAFLTITICSSATRKPYPALQSASHIERQVRAIIGQNLYESCTAQAHCMQVQGFGGIYSRGLDAGHPAAGTATERLHNVFPPLHHLQYEDQIRWRSITRPVQRSCSSVARPSMSSSAQRA